MTKIIEALKAIIENPDDLSTLPQLIAGVEEMEQSEESYQERINKLQQINKNYLALIPVPGEEPKEDEPEEEPPLTVQDGINALNSLMNGGN